MKAKSTIYLILFLLSSCVKNDFQNPSGGTIKNENNLLTSAKGYFEKNINEVFFINSAKIRTKSLGDSKFDVEWDKVIIIDNDFFSCAEVPLNCMSRDYNELNCLIDQPKYLINSSNTYSRLLIITNKNSGKISHTVITKSFENKIYDIDRISFLDLPTENSYTFRTLPNGKLVSAIDNFNMNKCKFTLEETKTFFEKLEQKNPNATKCSGFNSWSYDSKQGYYVCRSCNDIAFKETISQYFEYYIFPHLENIMNTALRESHSSDIGNVDSECKKYISYWLSVSMKRISQIYSCITKNVLYNASPYTGNLPFSMSNRLVDVYFGEHLHHDWDGYYNYVRNEGLLVIELLSYMESIIPHVACSDVHCEICGNCISTQKLVQSSINTKSNMTGAYDISGLSTNRCIPCQCVCPDCGETLMDGVTKRFSCGKLIEAIVYPNNNYEGFFAMWQMSLNRKTEIAGHVTDQNKVIIYLHSGNTYWKSYVPSLQKVLESCKNSPNYSYYVELKQGNGGNGFTHKVITHAHTHPTYSPDGKTQYIKYNSTVGNNSILFKDLCISDSDMRNASRFGYFILLNEYNVIKCPWSSFGFAEIIGKFPKI